MILSTDPDYLDTKLVKQGTKQLNPIFNELADWIYQEYSTPVLNIYYEKINTEKTPKLSIIFENYYYVGKFRDHTGNYDTEKQNLIAAQFKRILQSKSISKRTLFDWFFKKSSPLFETTGLFVIFTAFEPIAREEANNKIPQSTIAQLQEELASENIWHIYREPWTTTYFFYTEKQKEEYTKNGTTQKMKRQYYDILKQYDQFDYIKPNDEFLAFDSKENLDNNFEGNLFWYSKR